VESLLWKFEAIAVLACFEILKSRFKTYWEIYNHFIYYFSVNR